CRRPVWTTSRWWTSSSSTRSVAIPGHSRSTACRIQNRAPGYPGALFVALQISRAPEPSSDSRPLRCRGHGDVEELGGVLVQHPLLRRLVDSLEQVVQLAFEAAPPHALRVREVTAPERRLGKPRRRQVEQLHADGVVLEGQDDVALEILARQQAQ